MEEAVTRQYAHPNTVYHCLYAYYKLGYTRQHLGYIFNKSERAICNWIKTYEETGAFQRARVPSERTFSENHRAWLLAYYHAHPLAYLDEAQNTFQNAHRLTISKTSVWRIIHEAGFTWKALERRAMHIKEQDVFRFVEELSCVNWRYSNLVFLDEAPVSVLAFIGINGIIDYFNTDGTFDRLEFTKCCQDFVHSHRGHVGLYPGRNSVWILDGAAIHRHPEIVHYLRSVGVVPIFLLAYCSFLNPIEFLFGYVKRSCQRHYTESSKRDLLPFIVQTFRRFEGFNMSVLFEISEVD
ncbi:hypothetical protein PHYSODRAFT_476885 [Phytophthora sojae]|uniref:Tc1-like transposase DDE domain-containing protein n=1 Tax=Phytophthora sojae (strain P6497) TaxID=1094619 RepID=G4YN02_PHYSP|nr:hypothetical protein PHYSODRAFT_476885 [Phytophthora sojae]EGZ29535.1 hypothetical protein PHYSODRAFT_476885 [Phytophthora sojae]|eukprot:XP_009516810.1 hypothetical protein PHYSODRAFT_476885 [Phytophthora sojae]